MPQEEAMLVVLRGVSRGVSHNLESQSEKNLKAFSQESKSAGCEPSCDKANVKTSEPSARNVFSKFKRLNTDWIFVFSSSDASVLSVPTGPTVQWITCACRPRLPHFPSISRMPASAAGTLRGHRETCGRQAHVMLLHGWASGHRKCKRHLPHATSVGLRILGNLAILLEPCTEQTGGRVAPHVLRLPREVARPLFVRGTQSECQLFGWKHAGWRNLREGNVQIGVGCQSRSFRCRLPRNAAAELGRESLQVSRALLPHPNVQHDLQVNSADLLRSNQTLRSHCLFARGSQVRGKSLEPKKNYRTSMFSEMYDAQRDKLVVLDAV